MSHLLSCQFANAESATKALEQLNGFELAGRPMKVGHVTERNEAGAANFACDELDLMGMDQGTTSKQLMCPMTEGEATPPLTPDDITVTHNMFLSTSAGPGLIPPALQMSGAIAIGALAAVSGTSW